MDIRHRIRGVLDCSLGEDARDAFVVDPDVVLAFGDVVCNFQQGDLQILQLPPGDTPVLVRLSRADLDAPMLVEGQDLGFDMAVLGR